MKSVTESYSRDIDSTNVTSYEMPLSLQWLQMLYDFQDAVFEIETTKRILPSYMTSAASTKDLLE